MTPPDEPPPRRERSGLVVSSGWVLFVVLLGIALTGWAIYAILQTAR
jgi:hypothetical protein